MKREIKYFHVVVVQKRAKKCKKKKRDARAKLLFFFNKPIVFYTLSLPSASLDLKVAVAATLTLTFLVSVRKESIPHPLNKGSLGSWDMIGIVFYSHG